MVNAAGLSWVKAVHIGRLEKNVLDKLRTSAMSTASAELACLWQKYSTALPYDRVMRRFHNLHEGHTGISAGPGRIRGNSLPTVLGMDGFRGRCQPCLPVGSACLHLDLSDATAKTAGFRNWRRSTCCATPPNCRKAGFLNIGENHFRA